METLKHLEHISRGKKLKLPGELAGDFGPRSAICRQCVAKLYGILRADNHAMATWGQWFGGILGIDWQRSAKALLSWAGRLGIKCEEFKADAFLYALQTYYALLVELLVKRFPTLEGIEFSEEPFAWRLWADHAGLAAELECLSAAMGRYSPLRVEQNASASGDLLKDLYQALFPQGASSPARRILHARLARCTLA